MTNATERGDESSKKTPREEREKRLRALDEVKEMLTDVQDTRDWTRYMTAFVLRHQFYLEKVEATMRPNEDLTRHRDYMDNYDRWEQGMRELEKIAKRVRAGAASTKPNKFSCVP